MRLGLFTLLGSLIAVGCGEDAPMCYQRDLSTQDICALLGDACSPASGPLPALSPMVQVVPSMDMPEGVVSQTSHNNLDVIWYENRLFFAFRTAPSHFASDEVMLYVVSTKDQKTWTLEWSHSMLRDLREPRFLSFDGKLFLYFAVLGYVPVSFEPQYSMVTEYQDPCSWSEPERILEDGFIPWRTRTVDGKPYMLGYVGGENIYEINGEPIRVHWLTTSDGRSFEPVVPGKPVVLEGGSSETDWVFADDGAVIAVSRNEAGDEQSGWGSKICRAEPNALGDWSCVSDPKKYDSPIMFKHGSDIYLIGRRNVTATGNYDLMLRNLSPAEQTSAYNQDYWTKPKRCSLWTVDPNTLTVTFVFDLPSNGDTCFPGVVQLNADQFLVYNYTSPLDDPELKWFEGQTMPTFIYRTTLTFE